MNSLVVANVLNGLRNAGTSIFLLFSFQSNIYELAPFPQELEKLLS